MCNDDLIFNSDRKIAMRKTIEKEKANLLLLEPSIIPKV